MLYYIKNKKEDVFYVVKQPLDEDFHYEIEKDFIFTNLYSIMLEENNIENIKTTDIYYIPPYIQCNIKKYNNKSAVIMPYYKFKKLFSEDQSSLRIKIDLTKRRYNEINKGITQNLLDTITENNIYLNIVCLDSFFCNFDRHNNNIYFLLDGKRK